MDRSKYQIHLPLPPKIDPSVTMMQVEEKPDVTYADVGGCKEQIEKLREVVELPLLHPERFVQLGIDPPKGEIAFFTVSCIFCCIPITSYFFFKIRRSSLRSSRHRQDSLCPGGGQPNRCLFHSCHRFRTRSEICWRGTSQHHMIAHQFMFIFP